MARRVVACCRQLRNPKVARRVFVLPAFQKKSKRGIATPQMEIDLIKQWLKQAAAISEWKE